MLEIIWWLLILALLAFTITDAAMCSKCEKAKRELINTLLAQNNLLREQNKMLIRNGDCFFDLDDGK